MKKITLLTLIMLLMVSCATDNDTPPITEGPIIGGSEVSAADLADCPDGGMVITPAPAGVDGIVCNTEDGVLLVVPNTVPQEDVPIVEVRPAYNLKCGTGSEVHPGFGGKIVQIGFDLDGDGMLYEADWPEKIGNEVIFWQNTCIETNGGIVVTNVIYIEPNNDCPLGSYEATIGGDINGNKYLDADEVTWTQIICIVE